MNKFAAPIPGMSLTKEPGNSPWEQPPLYSKPTEALAFYLEKLADEDRLDDILFSLEQGMPLSVLIDSMTSYGVMEGYHTIDVKTVISPVLHEHLLTLAQASGIDVDEDGGPTQDERIADRDKKRMLILLEKSLEDAPGPGDLEDDTVEEAEELLGEDESVEEDPLDTEGGEEMLDGPAPGLIPRR